MLKDGMLKDVPMHTTMKAGVKFSLAVKLREHTQRKVNDYADSFLLFVSSRPHYHAEF